MSPRPRVKSGPADTARRLAWAESVAADVALDRHTAPPRSWREQAACADNTAPDLWVPFSPSASVNAAAAQVCDWCPARTNCLVAALLDPEELGVRAGIQQAAVTRLRTRYATTEQ